MKTEKPTVLTLQINPVDADIVKKGDVILASTGKNKTLLCVEDCLGIAKGTPAFKGHRVCLVFEEDLKGTKVKPIDMGLNNE